MRAIVCRGLADGGAPTHGSRDEHSSSSGVSFSFVGATQRPERDLTRVFLECSTEKPLSYLTEIRSTQPEFWEFARSANCYRDCACLRPPLSF